MWPDTDYFRTEKSQPRKSAPIIFRVRRPENNSDGRIDHANRVPPAILNSALYRLPRRIAGPLGAHSDPPLRRFRVKTPPSQNAAHLSPNTDRWVRTDINFCYRWRIKDGNTGTTVKKVKAAHTRLRSVGFRS